jgi:hypothetical protein
MIKKTLALLTLSILIINLILFATSIISVLSFWVIICIGGLIGYKLIPKLKN